MSPAQLDAYTQAVLTQAQPSPHPAVGGSCGVLDPKRLVCASTCIDRKFRGKPCKCYPTPAPEQATPHSNSGSVHLGSGECGGVRAPGPTSQGSAAFNQAVAYQRLRFFRDINESQRSSIFVELGAVDAGTLSQTKMTHSIERMLFDRLTADGKHSDIARLLDAAIVSSNSGEVKV